MQVHHFYTARPSERKTLEFKCGAITPIPFWVQCEECDTMFSKWPHSNKEPPNTRYLATYVVIIAACGLSCSI